MFGSATHTSAMMDDVSNSVVVVQSVIGDGPFIHIGSPTALATSPDLVVVGGNLGWAQWNGRSVYDRSDRTLGWFPVGIYRANDLRCLRVLTSRWEVNAVAIHPAGRLIAIGTGAYDGGYAFEGELLLHDVELGTTTSLLTAQRTIEALEWEDSETLAAVVAPPTDEDIDWPHIVYESFEVRRQDWTRVDRRSVDLEAEPSVSTEAVEHDLSALRDELVVLSKRSGTAWQSRRQVWAVAPSADGLLVGLESAIEAWDEQGNPLWRRAVDGACTQLLPRATGPVVANLWQAPETEFLTRPTAVVALDEDSGAGTPLLEPGHPAVLTTRSDGALLVRNTQHGRSPRSAVVLSATGEDVGHVELGAYDLFNHFFDIRRAPEFLVLVGDDPESWKDKRVAEVRRGSRVVGPYATSFPSPGRTNDTFWAAKGSSSTTPLERQSSTRASSMTSPACNGATRSLCAAATPMATSCGMFRWTTRSQHSASVTVESWSLRTSANSW